MRRSRALSYTRFAVWIGIYPVVPGSLFDAVGAEEDINAAMLLTSERSGHEWPDLPSFEFCY